MALKNKITAALAIAAMSLSLTACGSAGVNHAAAACDKYDALVESFNGSDIDALTTNNATFVATLAVWLGEGGEPSELYEKLSGYGSAIGGFILTASPEDAKTLMDYQSAESEAISSLCTEARG